MGLNGQGLAFYEFDEIDDAKSFKNKYRTALDNLPLSKPDEQLVIAEANYAFRLNMDVFDEIGSKQRFPLLSTIRSLFQLTWSSIKSKK